MLGLLSLGLVLAITFCVLQDGSTRWVWPMAAVLACALGTALQWRQAPRGQLRWDGERWQWSARPEAAVTQLHCVVDLQRRMLLRLCCGQVGPFGGGCIWLWLESDGMGPRWLALRRAILANAKISAQADFNAV